MDIFELPLGLAADEVASSKVGTAKRFGCTHFAESLKPSVKADSKS
jgi:hypothetical protein